MSDTKRKRKLQIPADDPGRAAAERMAEASGEDGAIGLLVEDELELLLYLLAREHLPVGKLENLALRVRTLRTNGALRCSNAWLATWAGHLAQEMRDVPPAPAPPAEEDEG